MLRREFIATVAALGAVSACAVTPPRPDLELPDVGPALAAQMDALLIWLDSATPWRSFLSTSLNILIPARLDDAAPSLLRIYSGKELAKIRSVAGFEDFGGKRLIEPGKPALSLLYFALASPRVRLPSGTPKDHYASLAQLEDLENYIVVAAPLDDSILDLDKYAIAVFAYEFRPGAKTPHRHHADMVYSRTGVSRVGTTRHHWDRQHRRFSNIPAPEEPGLSGTQNASVTPARFALFLAQVVEQDKAHFIGEHLRDWSYQFLLPVRKIVTGDPLLQGRQVIFKQYHRDEKLARLLSMRVIGDEPLVLPATVAFQGTQPPFLRVTCSTTASTSPLQRDNTFGTDQQLVSLVPVASSVLLEPFPAPMVREAAQRINGKRERLRFRVPAFYGEYNNKISNRRYTTLKVIENPVREAVGFGVDDIVFSGIRTNTSFVAPRNGPTFVNIRYQVSESDGESVTYLGPGCGVADWEGKIKTGNYWAALFQDNLCDGCVSADLSPAQCMPNAAALNFEQLLARPFLPAFSLVSAPDFLQSVDGIDLNKYDDHFLEGGTETVSGARVRANPHLLLPGTMGRAFPLRFPKGETIRPDTALTVTAVVSAAAVAPKLHVLRDYESTNSLPDTASNVFAPGWDITYSNTGTNNQFYFASFGLGSPFPEDMKLCAAANGMWPASSPDAARTFSPSLEGVYTLAPSAVTRTFTRRPPTAVPLLDSELGIHSTSPAVQDQLLPASTGWDGECGPFLIVDNGVLEVNFTDIGRADYVRNFFSEHNTMRMDALQNIKAEELIGRMGALRTCIRYLPPYVPLKQVRLSELWLVSAELVPDWNLGALGHGIPKQMVGNDKLWATTSRLGPVSGRGMLFVFAEGASACRDAAGKASTRRIASCKRVFVCQLAQTSANPDDWKLAWTAIQAPGGPGPSSWHVP